MTKKKRIRNFIIILFFIFCSFSQIIGQTTKDTSLYSQDTLSKNIIYYHNNKTMFLVDEATIIKDDYFLSHYYNPILIPNSSFFQQLSTFGSSCQDLVYKNRNMFDYDFQPNTFSPYIFTPNNIKYFQNKKAYTNIRYSNNTKGGQYFGVNFAKNLYKGLNLQTEYNVNYADGDFINSQVMNQFFNTTLNYISPKGRYRVNGAFVHNRAYILENGGIKDDSLFINNMFASADTYPTNLTQGFSKWKSSEYVFSQTFRLHNDTNTDINVFNLGAFVHSFSYGKYVRIYNDEQKTNKDSLSTRIIRNSLFWTNDIYPYQKSKYFLPISIGINYDMVKYTDSLNSKRINILSPEVKAGIRLNKLNVDFSYSHSFSSSYFDNDKQMNIKARYNQDSTDNFSLYANVLVMEKTPYYIYSHYRAGKLNWEYDVNKTKTKNINFGIDLIKSLNIEVSYFNLQDIYSFDKNLYGSIYRDANLWQVKLNNDFRLYDFGFKGMYVFQTSDNNDAIRVPKLLFKQSIYYEFAMFNHKLKTQVGVDLNYFTKYYADYYDTKTGLFVRQSEEKIGNYLYLDVFANMKISSFSFFLAFTHPYAGMFNYQYINTPLYPHEGFAFRYGLTWNFID